MQSLKIALVGYGRMGKEIHRLAEERNIEVSKIYDENNLLQNENNFDFDVAIDFSIPDAVIKNAEIITNAKKKLVIGTTGWYKDIQLVRNMALDNHTGVVCGSNFSIGMQMFFKIVGFASELMSKIDGYDIFTHEIHHSKKKDSPSGTAISIAKIILNDVGFKDTININPIDGEIDKSELHVSSTRGGYVPGTHTVYIDSEQDTIELTHRARNRAGFALGALKAAELINQRVGFYNFEDLLNEYWQKY